MKCLRPGSKIQLAETPALPFTSFGSSFLLTMLLNALVFSFVKMKINVSPLESSVRFKDAVCRMCLTLHHTHSCYLPWSCCLSVDLRNTGALSHNSLIPFKNWRKEGEETWEIRKMNLSHNTKYVKTNETIIYITCLSIKTDYTIDCWCLATPYKE